MGRIAPYLLYEDGAAAIDFLTKAFGFEEVMRMEDSGVVNHAELRLGDDSVMLGYPGEGYKSPKAADHYTALVHVYVDDSTLISSGRRRRGPRSSWSRPTRSTATAGTTRRIPKATSGRSRRR